MIRLIFPLLLLLSQVTHASASDLTCDDLFDQETYAGFAQLEMKPKQVDEIAKLSVEGREFIARYSHALKFLRLAKPTFWQALSGILSAEHRFGTEFSTQDYLTMTLWLLGNDELQAPLKDPTTQKVLSQVIKDRPRLALQDSEEDFTERLRLFVRITQERRSDFPRPSVAEIAKGNETLNLVYEVTNYSLKHALHEDKFSELLDAVIDDPEKVRRIISKSSQDGFMSGRVGRATEKSRYFERMMFRLYIAGLANQGQGLNSLSFYPSVFDFLDSQAIHSESLRAYFGSLLISVMANSRLAQKSLRPSFIATLKKQMNEERAPFLAEIQKRNESIRKQQEALRKPAPVAAPQPAPSAAKPRTESHTERKARHALEKQARLDVEVNAKRKETARKKDRTQPSPIQEGRKQVENTHASPNLEMFISGAKGSDSLKPGEVYSVNVERGFPGIGNEISIVFSEDVVRDLLTLRIAGVNWLDWLKTIQKGFSTHKAGIKRIRSSHRGETYDWWIEPGPHTRYRILGNIRNGAWHFDVLIKLR